VQPESYCQLDLHTDAATPPFAYVLRVRGRKQEILASDIDSVPMHRFSDQHFQRSIEPTDENFLIIAAAFVNRNDVIAFGKELQTDRRGPRLVRVDFAQRPDAPHHLLLFLVFHLQEARQHRRTISIHASTL
jgi:hypothetical protein